MILVLLRREDGGTLERKETQTRRFLLIPEDSGESAIRSVGRDQWLANSDTNTARRARSLLARGWRPSDPRVKEHCPWVHCCWCATRSRVPFN